MNIDEFKGYVRGIREGKLTPTQQLQKILQAIDELNVVVPFPSTNIHSWIVETTPTITW